jgi:hypothetical protein
MPLLFAAAARYCGVLMLQENKPRCAKKRCATLPAPVKKLKVKARHWVTKYRDDEPGLIFIRRHYRFQVHIRSFAHRRGWSCKV